MSKGKNAGGNTTERTPGRDSPDVISSRCLWVLNNVTDSRTVVTNSASSDGQPDVRPPGLADSSASGPVGSEVLLSNSFMTLSGLDDQNADVKLEARGDSSSVPDVGNVVQVLTGSGDQDIGNSDKTMEPEDTEKEPDTH